MFLLSRQDGSLRGHRHLGILGIGGVISGSDWALYGGLIWLCSDAAAAGPGGLFVHDGASIELDGGRAHGGAEGARRRDGVVRMSGCQDARDGAYSNIKTGPQVQNNTGPAPGEHAGGPVAGRFETRGYDGA